MMDQGLGSQGRLYSLFMVDCYWGCWLCLGCFCSAYYFYINDENELLQQYLDGNKIYTQNFVQLFYKSSKQW